MKIFRTLFFLILLLQSVTVYATVYNYSVSGAGLYRDQPGTAFQGSNVWGSMHISDSAGQLGYGGGPSFKITYFELFFDGGRSFSGTGDFLFSNLNNSGWISTWRLQGMGDWSFWYGESIGFLNPDGSSFVPGTSYNMLASLIDLTNMFYTLDGNGNEQYPGSFILNSGYDANQKLTLTQTGVAPVPEPGTMVLLGSGVLFGAGFLRFRRKS